MREIILNKTKINDDSKPYVIAEIGNNHGGSLEIGKEMIKAAKDCGANAVKFQRRNNKKLFTKEFYDSPYNSPNSFATTYGLHRDFVEMKDEYYPILMEYAKDLKIDCFATPFEPDSLRFFETLDMPYYKVASGDIFNLQMLKLFADIGKPVIISTGGCTMGDIKRMVNFLNDQNFYNYTLLQCTASYPCEFDSMDLDVITQMRKEFPNTVIGLSDHNRGIALPIYAYAIGARIIERHFTLDRTQKGTDHAFSLEPTGLKKMCRDLNACFISKGDGIKKVHECETAPLSKMRKNIYIIEDLKKGDVITESNIELKTPYLKDSIYLDGFDFFDIIGKKLTRDYKFEERLNRKDLE